MDNQIKEQLKTFAKKQFEEKKKFEDEVEAIISFVKGKSVNEIQELFKTVNKTILSCAFIVN